jgi:hypothetical protein
MNMSILYVNMDTDMRMDTEHRYKHGQRHPHGHRHQGVVRMERNSALIQGESVARVPL